jgi:hypothetical protein
MIMKVKLLLTAIACCLFYHSHAQSRIAKEPVKIEKNVARDSTLIKMVKGINVAIKNRYKHNLNGHIESVIIDGVQGMVPIDSLYNYNFNDFKQITISFNEDPAIYGSQAITGIIRLYSK